MTGPEYIAPSSLDESLELKQLHGENARVIAGGTDLILRMRDRVYNPQILIDLHRVSLDHITVHDEEMRIGANVTLAQILEHPGIASLFPVLAEACRTFAGPPIRNRATVGGNIVNASPAADLAPPLMAYDALVVLASSNGCRMVSLASFFQGPGQSVLGPDEILTEIRLPFGPDRSAACFIKLGQRRSMAISIVSVCTRLSLNPSAYIAEARIVLGAVAPTPVYASAAEAVLDGGRLSGALIDLAAKAASAEVKPITDVRASREYRTKMTGVLVGRALRATAKQLRAGQSDG